MEVNERTNPMTIDAAAKLYQGTALTPSAIRRLVRSGEIPSRRVGAKYLVMPKAIEAWLNELDALTEPTGGTIRRVAE